MFTQLEPAQSQNAVKESDKNCILIGNLLPASVLSLAVMRWLWGSLHPALPFPPTPSQAAWLELRGCS